MSGGNRSSDYRRLAAGIACGGVLLAGLSAGSRWHRAAKTGVTSPLDTTLAASAATARPSSVLASEPLSSIPLSQQPLTISHPAKRTPAPKSSASELPAAPASSPAIAPIARARAMKTYAALPMMFEANSGQSDPRVKFLSRAPGYTLFLTDKEAVLSLLTAPPASASAHAAQGSQKSPGPQPDKSEAPSLTRFVRLKFAGGNTPTAISGRDQLPGKTSYFLGNDPKQWHRNIANYEGVEYRGVYPGVDVVFHGNQQRLEYDFIVAPGADPHAIALDVEGAKRVRITPRGDVVLGVGQSELELEKPVVYQEVEGQRREVAGNFVLSGPHRIGFTLGPYDRSLPLVIDPTLAYSTYLGGSSYDWGSGIALDSSGNIYVTGWTTSTNFPTANPFQSTNQGSENAFVAKLNNAGTALIYSTYLGGSSSDLASGIAVDSSGNAYVVGQAGSRNFPTLNPIQAANNGSVNAFVTKLNNTGSELVYSTYLGGSNRGNGDAGYGIAVDSSGSAYVTGLANSTNFPTVNPIQATNNASGGTAFVAKLNSTGSALDYSTYLGGSNEDCGEGIAVDSSGNAYLTGFTDSTNFPTVSPLQQALGGGIDVFVTEINAAGSALVYSTYLGGSGWDLGTGIALDSSDNVYVTGNTASTNFPTENPIQTYGGNTDAFVTKLNFNPATSALTLVYSTYLGGRSADYGTSIAVSSFDYAYVTGYTASTNFPLVNPFQTACGGCSSYNDAFVAKLNPAGSALVYASYLGGSNQDYGSGIAIDSSGNAYLTGGTSSSNFPTVDPLQATNKSSSGTVFIAKISEPTLAVSPTTIAAGTAGVSYSPVTFTATGGTGTVTVSESGPPPSGMTFSNGTLSGTPTVTGSYPITIGAVDSEGDEGSENLTLVINCPTITVSPSTLANGVVGTVYPAVTFSETGGVGAITFSETGLPTGIGMTFAGGLLSGTPTTAESALSITVNATDSNGCPGSVTDTLTINSSTTSPVSVTDNETITVTDTVTFPDVADSETITVTDGVTVTPLIGITAPVASFSTSSLGFGTVAAGTTGTQTITVSNVGEGQPGLLLSSATIPSGTPFSIGTITCSNGASSFSTTLPSGGACLVPITYAAPASGTPPSATISFADNAALSNLTSTPSGSSYTQTVSLNGSGTTTSAPPLPPATVPVSDSETITVTDTETFPDVADSETIAVTDQVSIVVSQTITFTTPAPATAKSGDAFTVAATGGASGNPVVFTVGAGSVCTNSGTNGATFTMTSDTGNCYVDANQAGNTNYAAAPQVTETITAVKTVTKVAPTVTFTGAPASAPDLSTFTVAATQNSGITPTITATPAATCSISGYIVTMNGGAGTCTLTAKWATDDYYLAATVIQKTTAEKLTPDVTFTGAPEYAAYLSTFTVAATENSGITPTITSTTGSVCSVGTVNNVPNTVTMKTGTGACIVKAAWATNDDYLAASLEQAALAYPLGTTTTITSTAPETNPLKVTVYFTVTNGTSTAVTGTVQVTAASGGPTCTGSVTSGKCVMTFPSAESKTSLTATYEGNTENGTSTSAPYSLTVN